jgi:hypothetical protein
MKLGSPSVIDLDTVRIRLSRLLEQASEVIRSHYRSELSLQDFVDASLFREWRVGCLAFLKEAFGAESHYLREYEFSCDSPYLNAAARGQAVLKAAREYIDFGPVARVEELAAAEVFNDLLAIAERHCAAGRLEAATVLAAAILEDVLWRNARNRKLAIRDHIDGPASLNQKLWQAGVYPTATKTRIDAWMRLAQADASIASGTSVTDADAVAAAGQTREMASEVIPEILPAAVLEMIRGVRNFVADFLT